MFKCIFDFLMAKAAKKNRRLSKKKNLWRDGIDVNPLFAGRRQMADDQGTGGVV